MYTATFLRDTKMAWRLLGASFTVSEYCSVATSAPSGKSLNTVTVDPVIPDPEAYTRTSLRV